MHANRAPAVKSCRLLFHPNQRLAGTLTRAGRLFPEVTGLLVSSANGCALNQFGLAKLSLLKGVDFSSLKRRLFNFEISLHSREDTDLWEIANVRTKTLIYSEVFTTDNNLRHPQDVLAEIKMFI